MRFLLLSSFIVAFTAFGASASNRLIQCYTCHTEASFEANVRLQGPQVEGVSYVYVANSSSGVKKSFM